MGSKGDVTIEGVGGGEPRNDYTSFSTVLPSDFPDFDDGAGEIEEIPNGLSGPDVVTGLWYFQSSYDFFQFPGEDGFFGFSDSVTWEVGGRKTSPDLVVAAGDWWVDFDTSRIYSFSNNSSESYVHMAEQDLEITGEGAITIWPDQTVAIRHKYIPEELDDSLTEWNDLPESWVLPWYRFILQYARPAMPHHLYALWTRWQSFPFDGPSVSGDLVVYSKDGGETWHVPTGDLRRNVYDPGGADILFEQVFTVRACGNTWSHDNILFASNHSRIVYTTDFDSFTYKYTFAGPPFWITWDYQGFGSPNNRGHFMWGDVVDEEEIVVLYTFGANPDFTYPGGLSQDWHLSRMDTANAYLPPIVDFEPTGPGVCEFDGYKNRIRWLKHGKIKGLPPTFEHDYYFLAIDSGWWNDPRDVWNDTSWKSRVAYYEVNAISGTLADRGIGWQASSEPDFASFETIIHFDVHHIILEVEANGDVKFKFPMPWFIARYCVDSPSGPPHAWTYPGFGSFATSNFKFIYKIYVSSDLGQSYDLVHTVDKWGPPYETKDINVQLHWNASFTGSNYFKDPYNYGSRNSPRFIVPLYASDYGAPTGWSQDIWTYAYFSGVTFEGGILSTQQWPPEGQPPWEMFQNDFVWKDPPAYTDIYPNLYLETGEHVKWYGDKGSGAEGGHGTLMAGGSILKGGALFEERATQRFYTPGAPDSVWPPPPEQRITVLEFSEPQYTNYIYDRVVCSSAGFTIRAPHVNELKTKLQQLNANVRTGGTTTVDFGLEFTMPDGNLLPVVEPNNEAQPVRDDHYFTLRREVDVVIGQIANEPGSEFYCTDCDLLEYSDLMNSQPVAEDEQVSIRTLLGMRKTLQALYASGFFCSCYSYCPCQTFVDISIEGGKK